MLNFIIENKGTVIVCVVLIIIIFFAVRKLVHDRKNGVSSCGGDCSKCLMDCNKSNNEKS